MNPAKKVLLGGCRGGDETRGMEPSGRTYRRHRAGGIMLEVVSQVEKSSSEEES
jgi:hypothetical protein